MSSQTVTVEKLVFGGAGLARTEDGVVFVSGTAPGETVEIEITGKKGGTPHARPKKILRPSPARREPACPLYGRCGGCDWLHIAYPAQVECKKEMIAECMRRIGRIEHFPDPELFTAAESGYRRRAQLKKDAYGNAGFFARGTNDVVAVRRCPLLDDPLNGLLGRIADGTAVFPAAVKNLRTVAGDDGRVASSPPIPGTTTESVAVGAGNKTFKVKGGGFFQSNRFLLERLGTWASGITGGKRCVDLYGGCGFFSVMLADRFKEGVLIESNGAEAAAAGENFKRNGISHFRPLKGNAEELLRLAGAQPADCLIVDPPRPGLTRRAREVAAELRPETIFYVSCDPSTQARDAGFFVNTAGYTVAHAAFFDLYPNTHHVESLLILRRREKPTFAASEERLIP
jgi:23S rRNA (uracil1939-C5)-methyltransferase